LHWQETWAVVDCLALRERIAHTYHLHRNGVLNCAALFSMSDRKNKIKSCSFHWHKARSNIKVTAACSEYWSLKPPAVVFQLKPAQFHSMDVQIFISEYDTNVQ
jgi:hypothetical protein